MRLKLLFCLTLIFSWLPVTDGFAQTEAINQRAMLLFKTRQTGDISPEFVVQFIKQEEEPSLVCLATGMFIQKGAPTTAGCTKIILAAQTRPDCFHQILTQFALTQPVGEIVDQLLVAKKKNSNLAAAALMTTRSQLQVTKSVGPRQKRAKQKENPKQNRGSPDLDFTEAIKQLLTDKDSESIELALLAAAYSGANLDDEVAGLKIEKSPGAEGARLLYLAKRGKPLPADKVHELAKTQIKPDKRFQTVSAALATYDPTSHALAYLAQAIAESHDVRFLQILYAGLDHKDIRVQIDSAKAIEKLGRNESVPELLRVLPQCPWPTKVHVCSALGAIPDARSMPVLLKQLQTETGRLRLDCAYAMASIIGEDKIADADGWEAAWHSLADSFQVNLANTRKFRAGHNVADTYVPSLGYFYSQPICSDSLVYVVDTSASMKGESIKSLETHLADSMTGLKEPARFNIVTFGGEIQIGSAQLQVAARGKFLATLVHNLKLSASTRTHDAIQIATMFDEVDTIYYLSDGAPVSGAIGDWPGILAAYQFRHRYRPIALFAIDFEGSARNAAFMKQFARANHGASRGINDPDE